MPKKILHFTQARIKALPIPDTGRVEYYDDEEKRLTCRVSSTGNKTYSVVKWADNKVQRVTLGKTIDMTVTDARQKAAARVLEINSGINPTEAKRKKAKEKTPLGEVLEQYIAAPRADDRSLKPYTIKNYRYKLKLGFSDWLEKPINKITKEMVKARYTLITKKKGNTTANTTMRVLRLTLNYAIDEEMISDNPTRTLKKRWHTNNRKERIINSEQLKPWHEAVEGLTNEKAKVYFILALYMGFRSTELLTLEWVNVDMKAQTIELQDTKNGSNHLLPMPRVVIPYIKALNTNTVGSRWVFAGIDPAKYMDQPRHQMKKVIEASGVEFSPHDCRRSFATHADAASLPMTTIKNLMNHKINDVTGGYIVPELETLRLAINKVADYIQSKVTQKDNVIQLHAKG